jgi:ABC-type uncharacterized transport system YnjBCD ATPase subunit
MTNKERLISILGFSPSDANAVDGALIDAELDDIAAYTVANKSKVRAAAIYLLEMLLSTPDTGNSDPAFSIKYDRNAIQKRLSSLIAEQDGEEAIPTIRTMPIW